ncbi:MAG: MFS transporter [Dehalobacterium sp.]
MSTIEAATSPGLAPKQKTQKKAVVAGFVGNILEWFDYSIYGLFAVYISHNFFPSEDPIVSLLLSLMVFGLGFVARPIGGFIFGHLGDKIGRKNTLSLTVILMGASTFIMGILPTYALIGIAAPIILTMVRLFQGVSAGGEWGSAVAFLGEYARKDNRAFIVSFSQIGSAIGMLLGSLTGLLFTNIMSEEALLSWGWRIPFLFGVVIAVFGYYMRKGVDETPVFKNMEQSESPIKEAFKNHKKTMVSQFILMFGSFVVHWLILNYMVTYVNVFLKLPMQTGFSLTALTLVAYIIAVPIFGVLADKFGRKPVMYFGYGGIVLLGYPLFSLLAKTQSFGSMAFVVILMAVMHAAFNGPNTCLMNELYPSRVRVTCFSIPYQVGSAVFAGTAAMVATWLVDKTGNVMAMPIYIMVAAAVSMLALIFLMPETKNVDYDA